jgi:cytoskeletal protein RodZ
MPTVSEQLKTAREARGLTVYQIAESTKIRTDHIRAIDDGNFDVFSAPVYVKGFVRTYSTLVKLDTPKIMLQLEQELSHSTKHHEHPPLTKKERSLIDVLMFYLSKINWRIAFPVFAVVVVIVSIGAIYRNWSQQQSQDPFAKLKPGVYKPKAGAGEDLEIIQVK